MPQQQQQPYYDIPFVYTYDADALTNGASYNDLAVPMIDNRADFILRRVAGRNLVAGQIQLRDANSRNMFGAAWAMLPDHVVVPERVYDPASAIRFDLATVAKLGNAYAAPGSVPNYYSQLAFQGVRRMYGFTTPETAYKYYEKPYTIRTDVTITTTGRVAPAYQIKTAPQQYNIVVDNWDFELQSVQVLIQKSGATVPSIAAGAVKLTLYDANQQAMMTAPVVDMLLSAGSPNYNSCFPVPTVFYPASSIIRFDVESLLINTEVPATLTLLFNGLWRFPC